MERILGQLMLIVGIPALVSLLGGSAHAWNPAAHYIMAQELGLDPNYANLPDAWPSHITSVITEKFCWSHAVQDTCALPNAGVAVGIAARHPRADKDAH